MQALRLGFEYKYLQNASGGKVMIREASANEWTAVADLTRAAYEQYGADADPDFWEMYQTNTRETLLTDEQIVRIVETDGNVIAASVIYVPPYERKFGDRVVHNPYPEMRLLSVHPDYRNRGLADRLIEICEKRAREEGFAKMTLHTTRLMTVAKAMYERRGYTRFEEIDFEPVAGFVVWGYIKDLKSASLN